MLPEPNVKNSQTSIEYLDRMYQSAVVMAQKANEHTVKQWLAIAESRRQKLEQARQANGKT